METITQRHGNKARLGKHVMVRLTDSDHEQLKTIVEKTELLDGRQPSVALLVRVAINDFIRKSSSSQAAA